jgi:hypothetical protein
MPKGDRARWRKRNSAIGKAVGDPAVWDYETRGKVLATVKQEAHGFRVFVLPDETAGPFGDIILAKQAAVKRVKRAQAGLSPWQPPAPGG